MWRPVGICEQSEFWTKHFEEQSRAFNMHRDNATICKPLVRHRNKGVGEERRTGGRDIKGQYAASICGPISVNER